MSLAGYLSQGKGNSDLRMPEWSADVVGAEYEGDVLSGRISVEQGWLADSGESLAELLQQNLGLNFREWHDKPVRVVRPEAGRSSRLPHAGFG